MYLSEGAASTHPLLYLLFLGVGLLVASVVAIRNPKENFWAIFVKSSCLSLFVFIFSAAISATVFVFGMIALGIVGGLVSALIPDSAFFPSLMGELGWLGFFGVPLFIIISQLAFVTVYIWRKCW